MYKWLGYTTAVTICRTESNGLAQSKAPHLDLTLLVQVSLRQPVDDVRCNRKVTSLDPYSKSVWNKFVFQSIKKKIAFKMGLVPWIKSEWKWTERCCCNLRGPLMTSSLNCWLCTQGVWWRWCPILCRKSYLASFLPLVQVLPLQTLKLWRMDYRRIFWFGTHSYLSQIVLFTIVQTTKKMSTMIQNNS